MQTAVEPAGRAKNRIVRTRTQIHRPQTETATEAVTEPVEETMEETETGLPEGTEVLPEDALDAGVRGNRRSENSR